MADIKLYNTSTKTVDVVSDKKASELVASGAYEFIPGKQIDVVDPDGGLFTLPSEQAADAFNRGFQYDTNEMKQVRKIRKEYGDKPFEALGQGFLRGGSGALSDVLQVAADPEMSDHLRNLDEANPVWSGAGEIGGLVTSVLATGGTGAVAKTASIGAKTALGAGKLAEGHVTKALAAQGLKGSKSLARKILDASAPKAAGGAVEGALLGTGEVLSENALGRAELNAENLMAGMGYGALIGGTGNVLLKGVEEAVPWAVKQGTNAAKSAQKKFASSEAAALEILEFTPGQAAQLAKKNVTAGDLRNELNKLQIKEGDDILSALNNHGESAKASLGQIYSQGDEVAKQLGMTTDNVFQPAKYSEMIQKKIDDITPYAEASEIKALKKLKKNIDEGNFLPHVRNGQAVVKDATAGPFSVMKGVLDKIDDLAKHDKLVNPTKLQQAAKELRREVRSDLNQSITKLAGDPSLPPELQKLFASLPELNKTAEVMAKIRPLLDGKEARQYAEKFLSVSNLLRGTVGGTLFGLPGAIGAMATKIVSMDAIQMAKMRLLHKMEKDIVKNESRIKGAIQKFVDPVKKGANTARLTATKGLTDLSFSPEPKKKVKEDRHQAFTRVSEEIEHLANPETQAAWLEEKFQTLHNVAPYTHGELAYKAVNAAQFLYSKLPSNPAMERSMNPLLRKWKPNDSQLAKFERYARAVEDPIGVIERFGDGIVDREGVEVLENVYPELYGEFKNAVTEEVMMAKEQIPYSKRLNLKAILDIDVDPSTSAKSVSMLQANLATTPDEVAQQQSGTPQHIKGQLELDPNMMNTATQNLVTNSSLS